MDYLVTFLFIIIVAISGWYYGCEVKGWCGSESQGELSLDDALAKIDGNDTQDAQEKDATVKSDEQDQEKAKKESGTTDKKNEDTDKKEDDTKKTACKPYLSTKIAPGNSNEKSAVIKLEKFLNEYEGEKLITGGVYDSVDQTAVKRFQEKYRKDILDSVDLDKPNAIVGKATFTKINSIYCEKKK